MPYKDKELKRKKDREYRRKKRATEREEKDEKEYRLAYVDFEMSNLNADFGGILTGCCKEDGVSKINTYRIDETSTYKEEPWDDREICVALRDCIEQFDMIVTFNGKRFDVPFLNSRLMLNYERPLKKIKHIDLLYTVRYKLKLHSSALKVVSDFLTEEKPSGEIVFKTPMNGEYWRKAVCGNKEGMDYVVDHCEKDVIVLQRMFKRLKGFVSVIYPHG